jgi:hypothetical protein
MEAPYASWGAMFSEALTADDLREYAGRVGEKSPTASVTFPLSAMNAECTCRPHQPCLGLWAMQPCMRRAAFYACGEWPVASWWSPSIALASLPVEFSDIYAILQACSWTTRNLSHILVQCHRSLHTLGAWPDSRFGQTRSIMLSDSVRVRSCTA